MENEDIRYSNYMLRNIKTTGKLKNLHKTSKNQY